MKQRIIDILSAFFQAIDTILCRLHIKRPNVVVYMEGGICSQMQMYIQGQYYAEYGYDVRYDNLWFKTYRKDQYGLMPRTFELTEMWPNIEYKKVFGLQRKWDLLFFLAKRKDADWLPKPESVKHSIYLNGYWDLPLEDYKRLFTQLFDLRKAATPEGLKGERGFASFEHTVGIHVRRGDLAKGDNPVYGGVTDGYFLRAIDFCNQHFAPAKYLFFSDEPDWVEQNICPHLTQPHEIIRGNKAWEDLRLLSQCPVIVASQGSFGKVAAALNPDAVLIQCDTNHAKRGRENTYFIK